MNIAALLQRWNELTQQMRLLLIGGVALFLLAAILIPVFLLHNNDIPLFAKALSSDQINEVDAQLSSWQVPYTTTADNVMVDRGQRGDLLLKLSMVGIPHQTVTDSNDALSKIGTLTPQSVLDVQTRNAIASDLELALRGVDGIADAKVIIAPAQEAFFADEESHQASASVRLTMLNGRTLAPNAVDGIRHFVANGVTGLDPNRVTVLDDRGMALGEMRADNNSNARELQTNLQSALDETLGAGLAKVTVNIDTSQAVRQEYTYKNLPVAGDAIAKNYTDERLAGKDRAYSRVHGTETRGSQGIITRADVPPGSVARLSVAVFIDESLIDQQAEIRAFVAGAAGINASRGDVLTIAPIVFHHALPPTMPQEQGALVVVDKALPGLILGLTIIAVLLVLMQPILAILRRNANREILSRTSALESGVDVASIWRTIHGEPAHVVAAVISQLPTSTAVALLDMFSEQERREITERLARPIAPVLVDLVKVPSNA